jgi:putative ABC transport system permease protein
MFQDLRYGVRALLRNPGFAIIAVLTLALGIGVNTAIFSVVNALLLRPLPFPQPERLVWIEEVIPVLTDRVVPGSHFLDWQEHSRLLDGIAAYNPAELTLTGAGEPERLEGCRISASFLPLLGARLLVGRNFLSEEDRAGGERVAILSHRLWRRRFNADQAVVGRSVRLDDESYRVVGVLPPDFRFFAQSEIWLPMALDHAKEHGPLIHLLRVFARLKPGVTTEQATAELDTIRQAYLSEAHKKSPLFKGSLQITPLRDQLVGGTRRLLLILFGAVALILLIACANVANLTLARAVARQKELAIRAALGAGRFRLLRQLLVESLSLASAGGLCGLMLAWGLTTLLVKLSPPGAFGEIAQLATIKIDGRALGFTLLVSLLGGVLSGLAPALQFSRPDLNASLKEGGQLGLWRRQRTRQVLLVAEVALAVVLLIGAGLLIRSFANLLNVEPGFRAENLLTCRITLPYPRYESDARREQFQRQLLERVAALPGVERVGATSHLPLTDYTSGVWLQREGRPGDRSQGRPPTSLGLINADYFGALGIGLRAGRLFDERDTASAPRVLILSESLARRLFPGEDPVGKRLNTGRENDPLWNEVVGVVGDVRQRGLDQEVEPMVYAPYLQNPPSRIMLAVRSAVAPSHLAGAVRAAVQSVDPDQAVYEMMTMEERLSDSMAARRFTLLLVGLFALLALALAGVGVYGVISYVVTGRTHEVGVRMALGAQTSDVLRMVVGQGMSLTLIGVALGLAAALALTRVMQNLLFNVSATDPATFAGIALLLAGVALIASYIPARRATKVDPLLALRHE